MQHQLIEVDGIRLSYIEQNSTAPSMIFFIHGNSQSANAWRKQFSSPLFCDYRLVAFDLPAHGQSDFPKKEDCTLPQLAQTLSTAVNQLAGKKPYILVGVSLATNIVAEMLAYPVRPEGIVLAGPCVVGEAYTIDKAVKPGTHVNVVFADDATEEDVRHYALETSASREEADLQHFLNDYATTQKPFRSLLAQSIFTQQFSDEISLLQKAGVPLMVVAGKDEKVIDPDYLDTAPLPLWRNKIFKIDGASHLVNIDQPDAFNELLHQYVDERLTGAHAFAHSAAGQTHS